jgi:hypothetical protein
MFKKFQTVIVFGLLTSLIFCTNVKAANAEEESEFAAKIKTEITKLGTGRDARISVKLRDNTKLKGYVGGLREEAFSVVVDKSGASADVPYSQVKSIRGKNNLTGRQIGAIAGFAILVFLVIICATTDCV